MFCVTTTNIDQLFTLRRCLKLHAYLIRLAAASFSERAWAKHSICLPSFGAKGDTLLVRSHISGQSISLLCDFPKRAPCSSPRTWNSIKCVCNLHHLASKHQGSQTETINPQCRQYTYIYIIVICMYIYVCVYICMYVCMYVCMYACMHACMHVCMYVYMYVCMYGWMDGWMYGCMDVWMYGCMDVWMYGCMYVCI